MTVSGLYLDRPPDPLPLPPAPGGQHDQWRSLRTALWRLALAVIVAVVFGFLLLPVIALFFSMTPGRLVSDLHGTVVSQALAVSFETSLSALGLIVVLGTPVAYLLARHSFRGKRGGAARG